MIQDYKSISHFRGLNSLRFFAAFLVVLHHAESLRKDHELPHHLKDFGLFNNGTHAVSFFFVLSGFLITYLLLRERGEKQEISVKRFYLKRVFRIWPLYFLMVIIGAIIQPFFIDWFNIPYEMPYTIGETWYYFIFFVPGMVNHFFGSNLLEPLWSIGVEEVFYLIWAPLFKWIKKHVLALLLSVIAIKFILVGISMNYAFFSNPKLNSTIAYIIRIHQFESMAIGGLGAYIVYHYGAKVAQSILYSIPFQIVLYGLLLTFIFFGSNIHFGFWTWIFETPVVSSIITGGLFLYLILGVSIAEKNLFRLEIKWLSYLGEISYGIYMFHLLILSQIIELLKGFVAGKGMFLETLFYYGVSIPVILGVCILSKKTLEAYFERKKQKVLNRMTH